MKLFSKIALINGYNEDGNIRGKDGNFISNTDIVALIMHSMRFDKILNGEQDFINLLNETRIDAEWVINPNIKMKVMGIKRTSGDTLAEAKLGSEVGQKQPDLVVSVAEDNSINTVSTV